MHYNFIKSYSTRFKMFFLKFKFYSTMSNTTKLKKPIQNQSNDY
jgi:hypothetical protein